MEGGREGENEIECVSERESMYCTIQYSSAHFNSIQTYSNRELSVRVFDVYFSAICLIGVLLQI